MSIADWPVPVNRRLNSMSPVSEALVGDVDADAGTEGAVPVCAVTGVAAKAAKPAAIIAQHCSCFRLMQPALLGHAWGVWRRRGHMRRPRFMITGNRLAKAGKSLPSVWASSSADSFVQASPKRMRSQAMLLGRECCACAPARCRRFRIFTDPDARASAAETSPRARQ